MGILAKLPNLIIFFVSWTFLVILKFSEVSIGMEMQYSLSKVVFVIPLQFSYV